MLFIFHSEKKNGFVGRLISFFLIKKSIFVDTQQKKKKVFVESIEVCVNCPISFRIL